MFVATWASQILCDTGLADVDALAVDDDRSTWRTLRRTAAAAVSE